MSKLAVKYQIEIYQHTNGTMTKVAEVTDPMPLDKRGTIIRFSKELSEFGQCTFRVNATDDFLTQYGDVFKPHAYHVRLKRNGTIVWQGAIIDNPKRTSSFIEVQCAEYEWYLNKILINRTSNDPATGTANGIFRIFNSDTMASAITSVINETITTLNQSTNKNSILAGMTVGTVENPNFPPNMTDATGAPLTGAWNFSTKLQLSYDFQSVLYFLKSFGTYSFADFYIDQNLVFNYKKFVGNDRHYDVNFVFRQKSNVAQNNIVDYNLPRLGHRMVNDLWGIATDNNGIILNKEKTDQTSIQTNGLMQAVAAYADVKSAGILDARAAAELPLISTPDQNNVTIVLNETAAYPLGMWDIGDIVSLNIQNKGVSFSDFRRIVGVSVQVSSTGRELTTVQTNKPLSFQFAAIGAASG